jgi:hypothetical protein
MFFTRVKTGLCIACPLYVPWNWNYVKVIYIMEKLFFIFFFKSGIYIHKKAHTLPPDMGVQDNLKNYTCPLNNPIIQLWITLENYKVQWITLRFFIMWGIIIIIIIRNGAKTIIICHTQEWKQVYVSPAPCMYHETEIMLRYE